MKNFIITKIIYFTGYREEYWQLYIFLCFICCVKYKNTEDELYRMSISPLTTKRRPLYLKTQSVPRCKHFSSRL